MGQAYRVIQNKHKKIKTRKLMMILVAQYEKKEKWN